MSLIGISGARWHISIDGEVKGAALRGSGSHLTPAGHDERSQEGAARGRPPRAPPGLLGPLGLLRFTSLGGIRDGTSRGLLTLE